jgi:hypothetical protein
MVSYLRELLLLGLGKPHGLKDIHLLKLNRAHNSHVLHVEAHRSPFLGSPPLGSPASLGPDSSDCFESVLPLARDSVERQVPLGYKVMTGETEEGPLRSRLLFLFLGAGCKDK